ncbi:VacJ family lipoprotein [Aquabacterium sp.]|uniref:MlaA family lipoprotein n=1 Tax=Aquabacterium sp. TaxID=1872578 RepID=UPI0035B4BF4F
MRRALPAVLALLLMQGCATQHPQDPLESWNRKVFSFNETLDANVLKPVAQGYAKVTPEPVRKGVSNFFGNIDDVWTSANLFLQGRFKDGAQSVIRVSVNTTLGLGGFIDMASAMQMPRFNEDIGQTLGVWGVPSGPYIVWPVLGSSTLRDTANIVGNTYFSATTLGDGPRTDNQIRLLQVVNVRATYLSAAALLDDVALDKYSFVRDAYLQRRRNLIYNGNPPEEGQPEVEPRYDEPEDAAESAQPAASGASAPAN